VILFAKGAIDLGHPEAAAAAVVCFEWLQRPENVLGGYVTWSDYRSKDHPNAIKILHHKTGAVVWHPLEETTEAGAVRFGSMRKRKQSWPEPPDAVFRWSSSQRAPTIRRSPTRP
jgi:hypothetical protein